jgi:hypothetical protein
VFSSLLSRNLFFGSNGIKTYWPELWSTGSGNSPVSFPASAGIEFYEGSNIMKPILIRIFLLAVFASSISVVAMAAPFDDEKVSSTCPPAGASASQAAETKSQSKKKVQKEKQKMKKEKDQKNKKEDDNYPGFGIYG